MIDAFCTISVPSIYGGVVELVLDRIWLLAIIEVMTRTVLGYHLCFNRQYSGDDVLLCIKKAVTPWQPRKLTIPGLKYPEGSGFPSSVSERLEWALWDELAYDNAKSNLSERVREKLTSVVNCAVNAGPVATPERRPFIERFFGTLEENGFHRLPSTTGSSPKDIRRDNPEEKALEFHISLEHIEELTDVMIAQYNSAPHSGIGYRSPLEYLEYFIDSDFILPRQLPKSQRNSVKLLNIQTSRIIRGGREKGKSPHINFEGVRYRNDILTRSYDLVGKKLTLMVDPSDIRSLVAILPNGAEFGTLTAQGFWGTSPHTLEMRKAIFALRNKKLLWYTESEDPIQIYMDYLGKRSINSKHARRKLVTARQSNSGKAFNKLKSKSETGKRTELKSGNSNRRTNASEESTHTQNSIPKLKTFTY